MNAAGMRQGPIAAWEAEGTTCSYTFNPGMLPPGAQSLGESESVVSHTIPRISEGAAAHLARLIQIIWTENCFEEMRNTASNDNPQAPDIDMCDGNVNTSEGTAMSVDREEERAQPNARTPTGIYDGEPEANATPPDTNVMAVGNATHSPTHNDEEAQASGDNLRPELHTDDSVPCTQDISSLHEDCRSTDENRGDSHVTIGNSGKQPDHDNTQRTLTNTNGGDHVPGNEVISPTIPFTHPDLQSTDGDGTTSSTNVIGHHPYNEEVLDPRSNPDRTEQGNVPLNGASDANCASDANRQNQSGAFDTRIDTRGTHCTEQGNVSVDGAPDANGASDANGQNQNGAPDARVDVPRDRGLGSFDSNFEKKKQSPRY